MHSGEWLNELEENRRDRKGLGMYIFYTDDERVADILAEHDEQIKAKAIDEFLDDIATETEWRTESTAWQDVVRIAKQLKENKNEQQ